MSPTQVLQALVISAIMGMIGQGVRAVVGLKSASTLAAQSGSQQSAFDAAYFALSLMIGGVAGIIAGFGIGLSELLTTLAADQKVLLALAASGYAGADFIENAMTNFLPSANLLKPAAAVDGSGGTSAKQATVPAPNALSVRQSAQATLTILNSMQSGYEALGASPLTLLHRAADGKTQLQTQLNAAVSAYATMTTSVEKSRPLIGAVTTLTNLSDDATPASLAASNQAANDNLASASALNNNFSAALAVFKKNYDEILLATAKG